MKRGANRRVIYTLGLSLLMLIICVSTGWALPKDGNVVAGSSTITRPGGATMQIIQTTDKSIINWQSYSIGKGETVRYLQPGKSSISLNRVTGADPTAIYGSLLANGSVWVINPNGLLIGKDARINVGSFLGSTLDINNDDFINGKYLFRNSSAKTSGITHQGEITAAEGGYAVFISPSITNEGKITANGGRAYLAAGDEVTLNFADNDLIGFTIDKETAENALGIKNTGTIIANGGEAILSAKAAGDVLKTVINNEGIIQAQTVEDKNGVIKLLGGMENNSINISGTLDASAPNGGNGGFIETSAANVKINDSAIITTLAPNGKTGTWLIDPNDFTISATGDMTGAAVSSALSSNNFEIATATMGTGGGSGNIYVNQDVSWSESTQLKLTAENIVYINAKIENAHTTSGGVYFNAPNTTDKVVFDVSNGKVIIHNVEQLQWMNTALAGIYALGSDIDASATATWNGGLGYAPVGNASTPLTGQFDGLGHTITNLTVNRPSSAYSGLFGCIGTSSIVRNVGLIGGSVTGGDYTGGLIGSSSGYVSNSYNTGSVSGNNYYIGGLIGLSSGTVTNSYATGNVNGTGGISSAIGGLIGYNYSPSAMVTNSHATGNVSGDYYYIGGLVGFNAGTITTSQVVWVLRAGNGDS